MNKNLINNSINNQMVNMNNYNIQSNNNINVNVDIGKNILSQRKF